MDRPRSAPTGVSSLAPSCSPRPPPIAAQPAASNASVQAHVAEERSAARSDLDLPAPPAGRPFDNLYFGGGA
ncbi:MAG: hypothetical protein JO090_02175 [Rhizobacter sp.]|nr:hypothetical protein [Rhizobacter sp.]